MSANIPLLGETDPYKVTRSIRELAQGRSNAVGSVTLRDNQTTTTVAAVNCGADSKPFLFPATASAAASMLDVYIASAGVTAGQFIITHDSNAATDRTFYFVTLG